MMTITSTVKRIHSLRHSLISFLLFSAVTVSPPLLAQGTAFTYQGRLDDGGSPANGSDELRFRLASDPLGNNYVGSSLLTNGVTGNRRRRRPSQWVVVRPPDISTHGRTWRFAQIVKSQPMRIPK